MKVRSTNIGQPAEIEWRGQNVRTGIYKYATRSPILLEREDVKDDHVIDRRYHGGLDKACYIYGSNNYSFWKERYPNLDWQWGMFGENLTIDGIDESEIHIGDVYRLGKALVQVTQPRQPCFKLGVRLGTQNAVREFFESPYPGVYVRVLESGLVAVGDEMTIEQPAPDNMSLTEVFALFTSEMANNAKLQQAIDMPELAEACRKDLKKLLSFADE